MKEEWIDGTYHDGENYERDEDFEFVNTLEILWRHLLKLMITLYFVGYIEHSKKAFLIYITIRVLRCFQEEEEAKWCSIYLIWVAFIFLIFSDRLLFKY